MPVPHATCPESAPMWIPEETAKAACYAPRKDGEHFCSHEVCWSVQEHREKQTTPWPPPAPADQSQPPQQPQQGGRKAHVAQGQVEMATRKEIRPAAPPGWPGWRSREQQPPLLPPMGSRGGLPRYAPGADGGLQERSLADVPDWMLAKTQKRGRGEDQEEEERYGKTRQAMERVPEKFRRSKDRHEQLNGMLFDRVFARQDLSYETANAIGAAYDFANNQPNGGWRTNLATASLLVQMGHGAIEDRDLAAAVYALADGHILRMPVGESHMVQMQHSCIEIGSGSAPNAQPVQRYKQTTRSPPRGAQQARSRSPPRGGRYVDLGEEEL